VANRRGQEVNRGTYPNIREISISKQANIRGLATNVKPAAEERDRGERTSQRWMVLENTDVFSS
jgi:hypothetical protein